MKSLKDSLRDEFSEILNEDQYQEQINTKGLDLTLIENSFEKLLDNMRNGLTDDQLDSGRSQFQTFIVNHFKR